MSEPVATGEYPGISVAYYEKPYRKYTVNGKDAVSVTTALGVLNKPLDAWVERVTLAGTVKLLRQPTYTLPEDGSPESCPWKQRKYVPGFARQCNSPTHDCIGRDPALCQFRVDLKNRRLDYYAEKKEAADRGVDVHQIWQDWNEKQKIPHVADYPANRHGFIRALAAFIMQHNPTCLESEKVVGSAVHGFAGRLDTVVVLSVDDAPCVVDIKTSKAVYPSSHFPQLAGYEIARRECGLQPTERQGILRLGADGKFDLVWSDATGDDFLAVLNAWKSQQRWSKRR